MTFFGLWQKFKHGGLLAKEKLWVGSNKKNVREVAGLVIGSAIKDIKKKTVSECVELYQENFTSKKCSDNITNERAYFSKLLQFCGKNKVKFIHEITVDHIEGLQSEYLKIMKPSSVNRRFSVYRHLFKKCEDWSCIGENPFKKIKTLKIVKVHYTPWEKGQFEAFLKRTDGVFKKIFLFLWLTGCRPMELKNLKWTDIDYDQKTINFECLKNRGGKREFPLTQSVDRLLHSMRPDSLFVFSIKKKQINNDTLYQYCKQRLRTLGFKNLTVYGLRHAFACGLDRANINAFTIKELMGHSDIRTTLNYIHTDNRNLKNALKKVSR